MRIHRAFLTSLFLTLLALTSVVRADSSSEEARNWWIERAENGGPNMQYGLGMLYAMGNPAISIKRDEIQAAVWYLRAAEGGHADAQFALGLIYEDGRGVARNAELALSWYRKAAEQGHGIAKEKVLALTSKAASTETAPASTEAVTATTIFEFLFTNRTNFWDWWQGALALAFVTLAFWWVMRAPLGVSSSWDRIVHWREEEEFARKEQAMYDNREGINDAMLAETIAQFGPEAVAELMAQKRQSEAKTAGAKKSTERRQIPWQAHVTFLAMMMIGGLLASVMRGDFQLTFNMGADYARLFGSGPHIWLLLLAGGFLVGFGTRMTGGCTSGHGLSGCSRLQPGSLVGTAAFFGTAVVTSLILEKLI